MRAPVLAAGGIVLRQTRPPLIAVVRLRKGNEWVLPKGKLDDGETPRAAAVREVLEETGHDVSVHEFLGTLAYEAGGRPKIVHYWRMETGGKPTHDLMNDVRAVDWLPLNAAVERLSRDHERAFLANVGPLALENARRSKERKPAAVEKAPEKSVSEKSLPEKLVQEKAAQEKAAAEKPRRRRVVASKPAVATPATPLPENVMMIERGIEPAVAARDVVEHGVVEQSVIERRAVEAAPLLPGSEPIDDAGSLTVLELDQSPEALCSDADSFDEVCSDAMPAPDDEMILAEPELTSAELHQSSRIGVMQRVRGWLRRTG